MVLTSIIYHWQKIEAAYRIVAEELFMKMTKKGHGVRIKHVYFSFIKFIEQVKEARLNISQFVLDEPENKKHPDEVEVLKSHFEFTWSIMTDITSLEYPRRCQWSRTGCVQVLSWRKKRDYDEELSTVSWYANETMASRISSWSISFQFPEVWDLRDRLSHNDCQEERWRSSKVLLPLSKPTKH